MNRCLAWTQRTAYRPAGRCEKPGNAYLAPRLCPHHVAQLERRGFVRLAPDGRAWRP